MERRRCAYEVGGVSNTEIRWNGPACSAICLYGLILPSRQPEFDPWQILADTNDVAEMLDALQIAGIVPAEVSVFGTIDQGCDGLYPVWMSKAPEPLLHCRPDSRKHISAAQGVAVEANRLRKLLQEETDTASVGRKCVPMPWHLAGVAERSADGKGLLFGERRDPWGSHLIRPRLLHRSSCRNTVRVPEWQGYAS